MSILLDHGDKKNPLNVFISATADIPVWSNQSETYYDSHQIAGS